MPTPRDVIREIGKIRAMVTSVNHENVGTLPKGSLAWLIERVEEDTRRGETFKASVRFTEGMKELIDAAKNGAADLEFRRAPVLMRLDALEEVLLIDARGA
jgi:hypothetical protein